MCVHVRFVDEYCSCTMSLCACMMEFRYRLGEGESLAGTLYI